MSYLVLARKYRPQTFEELVGQEHVTTTLQNALRAKRLAHAYIFSGPRGCGKTTTARLLAKALNCVKGPTPTPCGQCDPCREIATGNSPDDVLEIDGASNRGIDQIREIRDTVKYSPARCRYRIYIIDEAHQITDAGFNALLKTLEEPPAHAVFMMATTEAQKFPSTILSRCQRFQLRPISPLEIHGQLTKIGKLEKLKVNSDALMEVARAAQGSLRDALSLLDQVVAYSPDGVTEEDIRTLLGLLPRTLVTGFASTLKEGTPETVLKAVQKAVEDGFDLFQLAHDIRDYWHQILLWKGGVQDRHLSQAEHIKERAEAYSFPELQQNLQLISRCEDQMRRSESPRVTFELASLEVAQKTISVDELLDRLEALEKGASTPSPASEVRAPSKKKPELIPDIPKVFESAPPPQKDNSVPPPPLPVVKNSSPEGNGHSSSEIKLDWPHFLSRVGERKPSLEPFLRASRWEFKNNTLSLVFPQEFHCKTISAQLPCLREILRELTAADPLVECRWDKNMAPEEESEMTEETNETKNAVLEEALDVNDEPEVKKSGSSLQEGSREMDPGLKKVMERFGGNLKKIDSHQ